MYHLTLTPGGGRTVKPNGLILCLLFFAISFVSISQTITTVVGNGIAGFYGDGGPANASQTDYPYSVAVDIAGNIYLADFYNNRIRKVTTRGNIGTIAGKGFDIGSQKFGDNGPAINANLYHPVGVAADDSGNVYIADALASRVRKISPGGIISSIAGFGTAGYAGDGDLAVKAKLNGPTSIAIDGAGNIYIADRYNNCVRKIDRAGIITTVAGNNKQGYSGDGEIANKAKLNDPRGVSLDAAGNLYIADCGNNCIRKVNIAGIITTIAGKGGKQGFSGDGGPAINAQLNGPTSVTIDAGGIIYVADQNNNRIRKITSYGIISTFAGKGTSGYSGDGGDATAAQLSTPIGVSADSYGNIYIADFGNYRIRKVATHLYNNNVNLTGTLLYCDSLKPMPNVRVKVGYGK
ncbi:MAG TPA: NHL repeat-containing protein, partial [Bacteroidia bacterium]|nr:NHL repeat-containing protein [Bacteroidia bacterium]